MIEVLVMPYLMGSYITFMLWPPLRGFGDGASMVKKEDETGLEVIRKWLTASLFWPVTLGVALYRWAVGYAIPWLTQPKNE